MKWLKKVAATPLTTIARVVDSLQTQTNDRTNAPSIRAVNDAIANKWETIYPVGSIYMSVNNVNPSTVFGGTWQQIKDKFLLACGDTYNNGATGGTATNTISEAQLPSHSHSYSRATGVGNHTLTESEIPEHRHYFSIGDSSNQRLVVPQTNTNLNLGGSQIGINTGYYNGYTDGAGGSNPHNHPLNTDTPNTGAVGSGQAVNNMPPYLAVNVWVRTA